MLTDGVAQQKFVDAAYVCPSAGYKSSQPLPLPLPYRPCALSSSTSNKKPKGVGSDSVGLQKVATNLHKLRARQLEEDGIGLLGAGSREERLSRPRGSVKQDALRGADADVVEHVLVGHGQHNRFDQLLDLLVQPCRSRFGLCCWCERSEGIEVRHRG